MTLHDKLAELRALCEQETWDHYDYEKLAHNVPSLVDALSAAIEGLEKAAAPCEFIERMSQEPSEYEQMETYRTSTTHRRNLARTTLSQVQEILEKGKKEEGR